MECNAIVVLAGTIKNENGVWVSTDLSERDDRYGAPGQILRVEAGAMLAKKFPEALVVASGGKGYDVHDVGGVRPLLSEVIERELVERDVSPSRIFSEIRSNSTYQQLEELQKLIVEKAWKHVFVVSNRWHLPRIEAIVKAKFQSLVPYVTIVSAEDILLENSPETWSAIFEAAYRSPFLAARIAKEAAGVRDIAEGTYDFR